jgi:hypothetical protein
MSSWRPRQSAPKSESASESGREAADEPHHFLLPLDVREMGCLGDEFEAGAWDAASIEPTVLHIHDAIAPTPWLIERRPGEGRATVHTLTPKGKALLRQGRELYLEVLSASFAPLDEDECAVLMRLLTKLLDAELPVESEASGLSGE